jgi:hypothetical protein
MVRRRRRMGSVTRTLLDMGLAIAAKDAQIERLWRVVEAARAMPRQTPDAGGAFTKHMFEIEASAVWALDRALLDLEQELPVPTPPE